MQGNSSLNDPEYVSENADVGNLDKHLKKAQNLPLVNERKNTLEMNKEKNVLLEEKIYKKYMILFESEEKMTDETNENFTNLKKNVKTLLRADVSQSTALEAGDFYEKHVNQLNNRIEHKMKNLEALLVTKERTMQLIRKENIHILERMNKIKHTVRIYEKIKQFLFKFKENHIKKLNRKTFRKRNAFVSLRAKEKRGEF